MAQEQNVQKPSEKGNPASGVAAKLSQQVAGKGQQQPKQPIVDRDAADLALLGIIRNVSEVI